MSEFERILRDDLKLATILVLYYRLNAQDIPTRILQEFIWQTHDRVPEFPRLMGFLQHWRSEVKVPIRRAEIAYADPFGRRRVHHVSQIYLI